MKSISNLNPAKYPLQVKCGKKRRQVQNNALSTTESANKNKINLFTKGLYQKKLDVHSEENAPPFKVGKISQTSKQVTKKYSLTLSFLDRG